MCPCKLAQQSQQPAVSRASGSYQPTKKTATERLDHITHATRGKGGKQVRGRQREHGDNVNMAEFLTCSSSFAGFARLPKMQLRSVSVREDRSLPKRGGRNVVKGGGFRPSCARGSRFSAITQELWTVMSQRDNSTETGRSSSSEATERQRRCGSGLPDANWSRWQLICISVIIKGIKSKAMKEFYIFKSTQQ